MRNWGIDWAWQTPMPSGTRKVRGQVMTHPRPPQFSLSEREQAEASVCVSVCVWERECVYVCVCSSLHFVNVDPQNQAVAALEDKEEKVVCMCMCVCVYPCLAESHRAWHGIFYTVRLASWWLAFDTAIGGVRWMKWWPSRKLQHFSHKHLFLFSPVTRSLSFPVFTSCPCCVNYVSVSTV